MRRSASSSLATRFPCRFILAHHWLAVVCLLCTSLAFTAASQAQTTSTIEGNVTDHQGLGIAGAEVQIAGSTLGTTKAATTDSSGAYEVAGLPAGTYSITVSRAGFASQVLTGLEVTLNRTLKLNISLEVGTVEQKIEVPAVLPL